MCRPCTRVPVVDERGWVADKDVQALLDAGFTPLKVLDILPGAALKMLSDYLNPPRVHSAGPGVRRVLLGLLCQHADTAVQPGRRATDTVAATDGTQP